MSEKIEQIKSLISKSGNGFHCRVINYFAGREWDLLVSPYYMDGFSEKPREIDIIVQNAKDFHDSWRNSYGTVYIKLFVECKYIPTNSNTVFWFGEKDKQKTEDLITSNTAFRKDNYYIERHHYHSIQEVGKLFSSNSDRGQENEPIYKGMTQCLNALIYNRMSGSIVHRKSSAYSSKVAFLEYPVILCNSFENFYKVPIVGDDSEPERITDNFALEINYAYPGKSGNHESEYFLIDVVEFDKLDTFLEKLKDEVDAQIFMMSD